VGRLTLSALTLAALLGSAAVAHGAPDKGPFRKIAVITLREESGDPIDNSVKTSVLRRIQEAKDWGADCVILDVESYGGLVSASIETGDELFDLGREVHTIAYVHRRAISGASMLSMACQEIVMSAAATIGDSRVVYMGPDGTMVEAPEKMQTVAAGTFRKYAEVNGYPVPVAESMVRQEMEVIRFRKPVDPDDPSKGFEWAYFRADTTDTLPTLAQQELEFLTDREVVVRENELPTFTHKEAHKYGICSNKEPVPDLKALLSQIQAPDGQVSYLEWTWAEQVSRFLLGIKVLLFLCGAAALYLALKTPGTGIPEVLALVFFGLFFGASAIAGFAGTIELVLFFGGIALIAVEIFLLPGFGVAGFAGLMLVLGSIALSAIPEGDLPLGDDHGHYLLDMAQDFLLGSIGAIIVVFFIARFLPTVPLFRRLVLQPGDGATIGATGAAEPRKRSHPLIGERGIAETRLRPAGRARIAGEQRDVVTEGAYVEENCPVRVVEVRGNTVVVRPEEPR
jgi:membrane-bound serine protease (ClpP class)